MRPSLFAKQTPANDRRVYVRAALEDATANQGRFFDADYSDALRKMAITVIEAQGPIRDDALVREVARAHGFARTSTRMKQRVIELLPDLVSSNESVGLFFWPGDQIRQSIEFRHPCTEEDRRSIDEIALPELVGLVREHPTLMMADDPAIALARVFGLARLAATPRKRLEEAIAASEHQEE